jgi:hypothetical protein
MQQLLTWGRTKVVCYPRHLLWVGGRECGAGTFFRATGQCAGPPNAGYHRRAGARCSCSQPFLARLGRLSSAQHLRQPRGVQPPWLRDAYHGEDDPAPSNYEIQCSHRHGYRNYRCCRPRSAPRRSARQSYAMFDFTKFDSGDIAEQAAGGNNPREGNVHTNGGPKGE